MRQSALRRRQTATERTVFNDRDLRRQKAREDPGWFVREILGAEFLYDKQEQLLESVRDNEQTSVNGANGVGKDWTIGRLIPWWLESFEPAKVILTAPTDRQISQIVWRETRQAFYGSRYPLAGRMLPSKPLWNVSDDTFALGFSTDKPWNITGFHSPNLLVIVSEAHNFPEDAFVSLKRLQPMRWVLSGNPFSEAGEFFDSHHDKSHLYNAITISAWDSPNVIAGDEHIPGLVARRDIEKAAADWGEESALYKATIDAQFVGRADGLIPLAWLLAAKAREPVDNGGELDAGVDVAGPGEDETVLTVRHRESIILQRSWRIDDPRGEVVAALLPFKARLRSVNVDSIGIGYNFGLHLQDQGLPVRLVNVGEAAHDTEKYANLKAELYWGLRMRFKDGDIAGLEDATAQAQLSSIRYRHNPRGQVQIESKDEARKRGVKSPDRAESILLAFAFDGPGSTAELIREFEGTRENGVLSIPERDRREDERGEDNIWEKKW